MRIDQTGLTTQSSATGRARRRAASFVLPAETCGEDAETQTAASVEPAAAGTSLLALGASSDGDARGAASDGVAAQHGGAVLRAMADLQRAMLAGGDGEARSLLGALARALPGAADPGLEAVLQAIAQRAAIELARSE